MKFKFTPISKGRQVGRTNIVEFSNMSQARSYASAMKDDYLCSKVDIKLV